MDLAVVLERLSWRRFRALLEGLSPQSALAAVYAANGPDAIEDAAEAERAVDEVWR